MRALPAAFAFTLLATVLPTAAAQGPPPECDADDLDGLRYFFAHLDGSIDMGDNLSEAQPGDLIFVEATSNLDCEGAALTVTTMTRPDLLVFDFVEQVGYRPVEQADFAYFDLATLVPECAFRIEVALETAQGNVTLDEFEAGTASCDFAPLPCPGNVAATTTEEGILITFDEVEQTNETGTVAAYGIWRAEGDAEFDEEPYMVLPPSSMEVPGFEPGTFLDEDVESGVTYRYFVKAGGPHGESEDCPIVEATAVPFFGAPVLGVLAAVGVVGAYVTMRRRT